MHFLVSKVAVLGVRNSACHLKIKENEIKIKSKCKMLLSPFSSMLPVWIILSFREGRISTNLYFGKVVFPQESLLCSSQLTYLLMALLQFDLLFKGQLHHVPFPSQCRETFHEEHFSRKCSGLLNYFYLSLICKGQRGGRWDNAVTGVANEGWFYFTYSAVL